jgi:DNA-binding CsgD family transcriptional regulator
MEILTSPGERGIAEALLDAVQQTVPGDYSATYCDSQAGVIDVFHPAEGWLGASHPLVKGLAKSPTAHPLAQAFLAQGPAAPQARSAVLADRLWRRTEIYNEVDRPLGIADMAVVFQPVRPGLVLYVTCGRSTNFRAHELEPLRKLQQIANALVSTRARATPVSFAPAAPLAPANLTPRERVILSRVELGERNAEIAHALGISPHTVRHHLEKLYAKLGVETRTAAARAMKG